jgi:hypothetical protein
VPEVTRPVVTRPVVIRLRVSGPIITIGCGIRPQIGPDIPSAAISGRDAIDRSQVARVGFALRTDIDMHHFDALASLRRE